MEDKAELGATMAQTTYGRLFTAVLSFKYLGRVLSASDDDWPEVIRDLQGDMKNWTQW